MSMFPYNDYYYGGFDGPVGTYANTGFGFGMYQQAVMDQAPVPDKAVKPLDPTARSPGYGTPYLMDMWGSGFGWANGPGLSYDPSPPSSPWLFWWMRKHPAIVLAYTVATLPFLAGSRTIEIDDDMGNEKLAEEMKEAAMKELLPMLNMAIGPATECLNFGQWLQEAVYDVVESGNVAPISFNSVLPTEAVLHCDSQRKFAGFQIGDQYRDKRYGFLAVEQPHINPTMGYGRNEAAKNDWWRALQTDMTGDRAAIKASGTHMQVSIPKGATVETPAGTLSQPWQVAQYFAQIAATCNVFVTPRWPFTADVIKTKPELAEIDFIKCTPFEWGDMGPFIVSLLERLDHTYKNIIRAWKHPERESTEGKHGTKAESKGQAQDIGVRDCEATHQMICSQWDAQQMAYWRLTNYVSKYGVKNTPKLKTVAAPLADQQQEFLQEVADALITDRNTGPVTQTYINVPKLLEKVEIPQVSEEEQQEAQEKLDEQSQQKNDAMAQSASDGKVAASADRFDQMGLVKANAIARIRARYPVNGNGRH